MGCCESKLTQRQQSDIDHDLTPLQLNENYQHAKRQMVKIGVPQKQAASETNSIDVLRNELDGLIYVFEQEGGVITTNFIEGKQGSELGYSSQGQLQNTTNARNSSQGNVQKSINSTDSLEEPSQFQKSLFEQNNSNLLNNASIATRRQLEKQLFYINTNAISGTKLLVWREEGRRSVDLLGQDVEKIVRQSPVLGYCACLMSIYQHQERNNMKLLAMKELPGGYGFRVFLNGTKRAIKCPLGCSQADFLAGLPLKLAHLHSIQLCNWTYLLTGWVPELIDLSTLTSTDEIFRRLVSNYLNGNILIAFTNFDRDECVVIKSIEPDSSQANTIKLGGKLNPSHVNEEKIEFSELLKLYPYLNVNWNPLIYNFSKKTQGTCQASAEGHSSLKFSIEIPPSNTEVEVRILIQTHCPDQPPSNPKLKVALYQCQGQVFFKPDCTPIRSAFSTNGFYLSQIFIFQKSAEHSEYVIGIEVGNDDVDKKDVQVTMDLQTFCQINVKKMVEPRLVARLEADSEINPESVGFGMNSPLFANNLQYALRVQKHNLCRISVKSETLQPLVFQIYLLPDTDNRQDLTLIRPQQLAKQIIQSDQFEKEGLLQFKCLKQNYIMVLVSYTPTYGEVFIHVEHYTLNEESSSSKAQSYKIEQIYCNPVFEKQFEFIWSSKCPGPRRRTKLNCERVFYPVSTYSKFFENPYFDHFLAPGVYQLSVVSRTFAQKYEPAEFESEPQREERCKSILEATPPSLSMGIFEMRDDKTQVKIVLDDYEYVPYGIGFWTQPLRLSGHYRVVLPKMDRGMEEGLLRIRRLAQN